MGMGHHRVLVPGLAPGPLPHWPQADGSCVATIPPPALAPKCQFSADPVSQEEVAGVFAKKMGAEKLPSGRSTPTHSTASGPVIAGECWLAYAKDFHGGHSYCGL